MAEQRRQAWGSPPVPSIHQAGNGIMSSYGRISDKWNGIIKDRIHYITSSELMAGSVKPGTKNNYRGAGRRFYKYLEAIGKQDPTFPRIDTVIKKLDIFSLDVIIREYLTWKFNTTLNCGDTLSGEVSGILYCLAVDYGFSISATLLPSVRRIRRGADNFLKAFEGEKPKGKYPIMNPILEDMLRHATEWERWALLLAQRYCLRSQHYCNNKGRGRNKEADPDGLPELEGQYIKYKQLRFSPNWENPQRLTVVTQNDKNNPNLHHMERTVECSCHTPWTCIVHEAKRLFTKHPLRPEDAAAQCRTGDMYYGAMRKIVQSLIEKIGLEKSNYGTHGLRSGGVSELFTEGRDGIFIQHFCWWNNIGSVQIYIKPNNPDMSRYISSYTEYRRSRLKESGLASQVNKNWEAVWNEIRLEKQKIAKTREVARNLMWASRTQEPVRSVLNQGVIQHRLPQVQQGTQGGPLSARNDAHMAMNRSGIRQHQYTNYTALSEQQAEKAEEKQHVYQNTNDPRGVQTTMGWKRNPYK